MTQVVLDLKWKIPGGQERELHLLNVPSLLACGGLSDYCLRLEIFLVKMVHERRNSDIVKNLKFWEKVLSCHYRLFHLGSEDRSLSMLK